MSILTSRFFYLTKVVALLAIVAIFIPLTASASIIGLYYRSANDTLSVFMVDGRPFLKIEVPNFQDLPECQGFQLYQTIPFERTTLEFVSGPEGKGTGFALWESRECLEAQWKTNEWDKNAPTKNLVQEIDIYNDFFALFTNKEDLIRGFEAGEFFLAVMYQDNYDRHESTQREIFYAHEDAVNGKVLFGPEEPSVQ